MLFDENGGSPKVSRQDSASYSCIDPPHYDDQDWKCADTVGATADGPYNNPEVPASRFFSAGPTPSPFKASGQKSLALCGVAFNQSFVVAMKELGQYKLTATGMQVPCTVRHYTTPNAKTGVIPADFIVSCGAPYPYSVQSVKAQVWCSGYSLDWSGNHSFLQDECKEVPGRWTCGPTITAAPKFSGVTVPATGIGVLGDGAKRPTKWAGPTLSGQMRSVRLKQSKLFVDPGSTPYRAGQSVNGSTQPFVADPYLNSWLTGWTKIWNIGFQEASMPTKTWQATPSWLFKADFATTTISRVTINWTTGAVAATTTTTWVPGTGQCDGTPFVASVNRARNTR
ncbi:MAG: hypothetical protein ACOH1Y_11540 [Propionicimonas sp.]